MKFILIFIVAMSIGQGVLAGDLSFGEKRCLKKINSEVSFILSRIDSINHEFEEKLKADKLAKFKTKDYSTQSFLDNSIRKYRMDIRGQVKAYPNRYKKTAERGKAATGKHCLDKELSQKGIVIIHNFEVNWEQAIAKAQTNKRFFQQLEETLPTR